jgi:hypothetical protein
MGAASPLAADETAALRPRLIASFFFGERQREEAARGCTHVDCALACAEDRPLHTPAPCSEWT